MSTIRWSITLGVALAMIPASSAPAGNGWSAPPNLQPACRAHPQVLDCAARSGKRVSPDPRRRVRLAWLDARERLRSTTVSAHRPRTLRRAIGRAIASARRGSGTVIAIDRGMRVLVYQSEGSAARLRPARTHAPRAARAAPGCPNCDAAEAAVDAAVKAYIVAYKAATAAREAADAAALVAAKICEEMPGTLECEAALKKADDANERARLAAEAMKAAAAAARAAQEALDKCKAALRPCPQPAEYAGMGFASGGEPPTGSFEPAAWLVIGLGMALTTGIAAAYRKRRWRPGMPASQAGLTLS